MLPNPEIREVNILDYLKIIQKRLAIILGFLIVIPSTAAILSFATTPLYKAKVSILIQAKPPQITKFEEVYHWDQQYLQNQYNILTSRALAERVYNDLKLSSEPDFQVAGDPVGKLHKMISVEPIKNSQIVYLQVIDTDSLRASSIANAFSKAYVQQDIDIRNAAAKEAVGWLESQLVDIKSKLQESEEALNKYIQDNKIVTTPDVEKKTQSLLESLKQNKSKLETERAELNKRYKEKHPKMVALSAQLEDTNKKIELETESLLDLTQKMVKYNMLKKEVESSQALYTSMLTRAKETGVTEKIEASGIRIIDYAKPSEAPFKPQKTKNIVQAIFLAVISGVGFAFFLEYLDSSIRTADDVSSYLNLPFLGYLPATGQEAKIQTEKDLICFQKPKSTITESYRAVRTSILFASPGDKPLKCVLITSSLPQEGKSFFSSNLSIIFSQVNEKVILLDIDMRKPRLNKVFNAQLKFGLSDFLTGNAELDAIIRPTSIPNLSIVTSGTIPPNPSELLTSGKVRLLFEQLKSKFDRIIVDSPPVLSAADTSLLANMVDGVVLVVKGASTRLEVVLRTKMKILEAKAKIIGVVVNNIEPEKEDRYYYYHYYYAEGQKPK